MELRKTDNYYGACLATEPPLPFGLSGGGFKLQTPISGNSQKINAAIPTVYNI
jgi:hypothetical protein